MPALPADEEPIPLSAVQHAVYCLRQAALIHLERLWAENRFTAEGDVLHADDGYDMTVTKVDGRRIETIEVRKAGAPDHAPVSAE